MVSHQIQFGNRHCYYVYVDWPLSVYAEYYIAED